MKIQDKQKLREMSLDELRQKLYELYKEYNAVVLKKGAYKLDNVSLPKKIKHDIAVVKTIMREKELAELSSKEN